MSPHFWTYGLNFQIIFTCSQTLGQLWGPSLTCYALGYGFSGFRWVAAYAFIACAVLCLTFQWRTDRHQFKGSAEEILLNDAINYLHQILRTNSCKSGSKQYRNRGQKMNNELVLYWLLLSSIQCICDSQPELKLKLWVAINSTKDGVKWSAKRAKHWYYCHRCHH